MQRTFVQTKEFTERWDSFKLTDEDLRILEELILTKPHLGKVIRGTGGLRKIRLPIKNRGKSAGARVCYVDFVEGETIYLITVYLKKEKDNLTASERNQIKKYVEYLKESI